MIRHMVVDIIRCLIQFPRKNGISDDLSPANIVTGHSTPKYNTMKPEFGTYVQVFEDNTPSNTPRARSCGAIALDPTGNAQGDYIFMSLATAARISRHQRTALPMTDTVIARVHALGIADEQPLIQERGFVVEWRPDHPPIDDSEYNRDYYPRRNAAVDAFSPHLFDPIDDNEADLLADAKAHGVIDPADDSVALDQGANNDNNKNLQQQPPPNHGFLA